MKAMLLAAGLGSRLKPYTLDVPKPLFPVLGVPIIEWALRRLALAGTTEAVINLHHLPAPIVRRLSSGSRLGLNLTYSEEPILLGTGGGLSAVRGFFEGEECFILHNGDVFHDWDLAALERMHLRSGAQATMALVDDPQRPEAQLVELDGDKVVGIRGEPEDCGGPRYIFSGVSVLSRSLFTHLPDGEISCLVERGLMPMIGAGLDIRGVVMEGIFCDIGTPQRYLDLHWDLISRAPGLFAGLGMEIPREPAEGVFCFEPQGTVEEAIVSPPTLVCRGAIIGNGAAIGPRVVLCEDSAVEDGAMVQDAVVFPGAVVRGNASGIVTSRPAA